MWGKVWHFIKEKDLLQPGDRVLVAVSGGADSVCLLKVLAENQIGLALRAMHVHHGLRGEEADRDARFVQGICQRLKIPLEIVYRRAGEYARENRISEEEAGRILRYEALEEAAARWEEEISEQASADEKQDRGAAPKQRPVQIAVAHHQDDNAETILHHLLRGSGLRGLAGMRPVQGNRIRPLLGVRRSEIVAYLQEAEWEWCEDSSNESGIYTRNRIRRELIPCMIEKVNARAVENILHAGELMGQADHYLEQQAIHLWKQLGYTEKSDGNGEIQRAVINREGFLAQEKIIRTYLIHRMLMLTAPEQKDITAKHIQLIESLADCAVGSSCDLPGGLRAVRSYQEFYVEHRQRMQRPEPAEVNIPAPGEEPVRVGDFEFRAFFRENGVEIPKKEYTKWFDYDKIKATLSVRGRQQGDFFTLPGGGRKMLSRFLIDEKIPRGQREHILVLAEENQILWVVGYRIGEYYKITEATHSILQVDFYGGKAYG
ncbi:MAG: tRNA lysidine(34) synthetase TilS [Lachnospiraceae bacterium]|nr:tRNA lysidine(34) synthetase TilS [Lachnospiraceae bacterium]